MSVEVDDVWLYEMILDYLKKTEEKYPILVRESPHFSNGDRKIIVEWISKLTKIFKIGVEAHHLAIFLFDFFIADHQADSQGLYLIGAAAFSIACKANDIEVNIPQASKILKLAPFENVMQSCLLKSTEILLLQHFNWNVHKPTEASFLEYYSASCLAIELEGIVDQQYANKIAKYFHKWVTYFREKVLLNDEFRDYLPSKVACAIVVSTRISMSLVPEWPDFMAQLTDWFMPDLIQIVKNLRNGLKYDLMMENNQTFHLYEPGELNHELKKLNNEFPNCSNQGDVEIRLSSISKTDNTFLHFVSSVEPFTNGTSIPIEPVNHEHASNYFTNSTQFYDASDTSLQNSNVFLNSHYVSLGAINKPSIYLSNSVNGNQKITNTTQKDSNQLYLSNHESHDKSIESLSNACDTSFNISSGQYSSTNSSSISHSMNSIISYYKQPIHQLNGDELVEPYELPLNYLTPISDPISSSSSMYLILSQTDDIHNKQYHSKHAHSIIVNPNNIPPRRSQNRDSIISNSMNNGYYALKKRAPGLVINVNGAGSSYSFNCINNVKSSHP